MNRLTLRGIDEELASCIRRLATQEGISLNRAVLQLLRAGAGLGQPTQTADRVGVFTGSSHWDLDLRASGRDTERPGRPFYQTELIRDLLL